MNPAHQAGQDDDRHDIRRHLQEFSWYRDIQDLHLHLERVSKTEDQRRPQCPDRIPVAEDHRRQADETLASRHELVKTPHRADGEIGSAHPGHHSAQDDVHVAGHINIDAQRICGLRMFAHRPGAQAPAGVKQHHEDDRHQDEHEIYHDVVLKKDRPQDRDFNQAGDGDVGENRGIIERIGCLQISVGNETGCARPNNIDRYSADDLVHLELNDQNGMQSRHDHPGQHPGQ